MRKLRTGTPQPEMWDVDDIMSYLACDKNKAEEIMKECKNRHEIKGYGAIENISYLILSMRSSALSESVKLDTMLTLPLLVK